LSKGNVKRLVGSVADPASGSGFIGTIVDQVTDE